MLKVFSQESCPNCDELKSYLKANNFEYEEIDVNKDFKAKAVMLMNDVESTPAVDLNGSILSGSVDEIIGRIGALV